MAELHGTGRVDRCWAMVSKPGGSVTCARRATIGAWYCHQHGGGRCYCPRYEQHSGPCRGKYCRCHG